ncbi:MAG TPA: hypothetical protein PLV72_03105 [Candidatus Magasanikbacteria bacterium]|nr:hypothetical protein [Candidatus Magasanikbacteria bacterium]
MKKYNNKKIADVLMGWGKENRGVSENNNIVKEKVLDSLHSVASPKVRPSRFLFLKIALAGCAGVAVVVIFINSRPIMTGESTMSSPAMDYAEDGAINFGLDNVGASTGLAAQREGGMLNKVVNSIGIGRYSVGEADITDTREFLKTNYRAEMRTRGVEKMSRQIQTMVRGYEGRVDRMDTNNKYANISFVIPKSSLETFQNELRGMVGVRFFNESMSSNNLLPQKQNIEKNTENNLTGLSDLQTQKKNLTENHDRVVAEWQKEIVGVLRNISELRQEVTTSTARQKIIAEQISGLTARKDYLVQRTNKEKVEFQNQLSLIDSGISITNQTLDNLENQDQKLLADVETVQCSVSVRWISVWEIVNLYVPVVRVLVIVFGLVIVGYFVFGRRQREFDLP